jgi:hypothetical protein
MLVPQVRAYFRNLIDETDVTFVSDADIGLYLKIGYDQFRKVVTDIDPWSYAITYVFAPGNVTSYNMATQAAGSRLLGGLWDGSVAGNNDPPRLQRILALARESGTARVPSFYFKATDNSAQLNGIVTATAATYMWQREQLVFDAIPPASLILYYVPSQEIGQDQVAGSVGVDWTGILPAAFPGYIDVFEEFHDLIALYAAQQYTMRDAAAQPIISAQLKARIEEFKSYLMFGRVIGANNQVVPYDPGW